MKYCVPYNKKNIYLDSIDEYIISYKEDKNLIDFIKKYPNKRIIVSICGKEELFFNSIIGFKLFKNLYKENKNFILLLDKENCSLENFQKIKENKIPFFVSTAATNFDEIYNLIDLGVSDIYITNELGFNLKEVANILHKNKINIRAFPNTCQTISNKKDIFGFFIRPEDVNIYEPFIDVFEFDYNFEEQIQTYFKIYEIDKKWQGDLSEIIINLNMPIENQYIIKQFAEARLGCRKGCLENKPCRICNKVLALGNSLKKAKVQVKNK